jgi:hypothetical protein
MTYNEREHEDRQFPKETETEKNCNSNDNHNHNNLIIIYLGAKLTALRRNKTHNNINNSNTNNDRPCGLVVRVPGYRSRGPAFDSRRYHIF